MNIHIKHLLLLIITLIGFLCISTGSTVSANRIHIHHHSRISRVEVNSDYKRIMHNGVYNIKIDNRHSKILNKILPKLSYHQLHNIGEYSINNKNVQHKFNRRYSKVSGRIVNKLQRRHMNSLERSIVHYDFLDINHIRRLHHRHPVQLDVTAQKLANMRAKQAYQAYSHNKNVHGNNSVNGVTNLSKIPLVNDAEKLGISGFSVMTKQLTENANNICFTPSGTTNAYLADGKGTLHYYSAKTPKRLAKVMNDGYVNHDTGADNGHRNVELNKNYYSVGISVYYNRAKNQMATVEVYDEDF